MNMVYVRFCSWNKEKIYFFCFWKLSVQFSKHKISGIFRNSIIPIWVRSFVGLRMRKNRLTTSEFACFQNQQISGGRSNARKLRMTHTLPDRYNIYKSQKCSEHILSSDLIHSFHSRICCRELQHFTLTKWFYQQKKNGMQHLWASNTFVWYCLLVFVSRSMPAPSIPIFLLLLFPSRSFWCSRRRAM